MPAETAGDSSDGLMISEHPAPSAAAILRPNMTPGKFQEECAKFSFGDGELTEEEEKTWDRCASNAEYHYLGSGKTFVRFGKALAEAMLEMK